MGGIDIATLGVRVTSTGAKQVEGELDSLGRKGDSVSRSLVNAGRLIAGAWLTREFIKNTVDAQNAVAQLEAAVKSTGGAAGMSTQALQDLAAALSKTSTYSDEAIMGAESLLLTFTQIGRNVFPRATQAVVDLSTRMGGDLSGASIQLGKALNDPILGITALTRVGVSFSESQKEVIKQLVEAGQMEKAQGVILKELEVEFGGSAKAARDTLGGALTALKNAFGETLEVSRDASSGIVGAINAITDHMGTLTNVGAGGLALAGVAYVGRKGAGIAEQAAAAQAARVAALEAAKANTALAASQVGAANTARVAAAAEYEFAAGIAANGAMTKQQAATFVAARAAMDGANATYAASELRAAEAERVEAAALAQVTVAGRAAAATKTAWSGLLALFGGPWGLALTATAGAVWGVKKALDAASDSARKWKEEHDPAIATASRLSGEIGNLAGAYAGLSAAQKDAERSRLQAELAPLQAAIRASDKNTAQLPSAFRVAFEGPEVQAARERAAVILNALGELNKGMADTRTAAEKAAEAEKAYRDALTARVQTLSDAQELGLLNNAGLRDAQALEGQLKKALDAHNLSLEKRVFLTRQLLDVHETLAGVERGAGMARIGAINLPAGLQNTTTYAPFSSPYAPAPGRGPVYAPRIYSEAPPDGKGFDWSGLTGALKSALLPFAQTILQRAGGPALGGAASGALAGFMVGGPWGALAGGLGGLVSGLLGAGKAAEEMAKAMRRAQDAFNDSVQRQTASLLARTPGQRAGLEMQPYLAEYEKAYGRIDRTAHLRGTAPTGGIVGMMYKGDLAGVIAELEAKLPTATGEAQRALQQMIDLFKIMADEVEKARLATLQWTNSLSDLQAKQNAYAKIFGKTLGPNDAMDIIAKMSPELAKQFGLGGLDLTSKAGQSAAMSAFQDIYKLIESGGLTSELLGTFTDKNQLLASIMAVIDSFSALDKATSKLTTDIPKAINLALYERQYAGAAPAFGGAGPRYRTPTPPQLPVNGGGVTLVFESGAIVTQARSGEQLLAEVERAAKNRVAGGSSVVIGKTRLS